MPSATSDTWNTPQITPPPPSPAIVGARYRDTSPSADPDYEARFPEAPAEITVPLADNPEPISRQPSSNKSHHRADSTSTPKPPCQKKKRTRSSGTNEDPAIITRRSQYTSMPLNYYPPPQYQTSSESYGGSSGGYTGYNSNGYGNNNNPYSPVQTHSYPPPPRVEYDSAYYQNTYTFPSPPPESTFVDPVFEYSKKLPSRNSRDREYYENGKGIQNISAPMIRGGRSAEKIPETAITEEGKELAGEDLTAKEKDETETDKTSARSCSSHPSRSTPPTSPSHSAPPSPTHRPTGYPHLASTLATTPSLTLYRRFSTLQHLILLHLQDEISELETVLSDLDAAEYTLNGGAALRARRGMGTSSRRLQVMGAIAFKLQQYNKALKGYTDMQQLPPADSDDIARYKSFMETSRPLVKAEGMVLLGHTDDLACLQRKKDTVRESREVREVRDPPFSPAFKLGISLLSCSLAGLARWRVASAPGAGVEVPLALVAGATGGAAAMMWAFL